MRVTIYHNPKCSKSRETLALLRERGVEPHVVEYLKTPPSAAELGHVLGLLGRQPRELMRTKESTYRQVGADDASLGHDALIALMVEHPVLIERPIVVVDDARAEVGRPPENVLRLLEHA